MKHPFIDRLLQGIALEEKEQAQRYKLDEQHSLKALKAEGLALHPIAVTRKTFGYADYPEISFRLPFPPASNLFRDGAAIECFIAGEEPIKGVLLSFEGNKGEFRLYAPDFPDWVEDDGVGIKLAPDTRTTGMMKNAMDAISNHKKMSALFASLHDTPAADAPRHVLSGQPIVFGNARLNESQQQAVRAVMENESIVILHGPPGTGKTTTLAEAIVQLTNRGEKVLVSAPSNTAVDTISIALLERGVRLLRVGNTSKVDDRVFPHTPEGKLQNSKQLKEIRQLKLRAEEFRRMALKYKRNFGKAEREQRNLLFKEVRSIREEIKKIQHYNEEKLFDEAMVIAGTPVGLADAGLEQRQFSTVVIDEAGQCLEPLAWCIFPLAEKIVLAGDPWQLPPTVLSQDAIAAGFNQSVLEAAIHTIPDVYLLDTQYRMRPVIAGFSSNFFYKGALKAAGHLQDEGAHLVFIDTAGSGSEESRGSDGTSLQNEGELDLAQKLLDREISIHDPVAFISPYAGQVTAAKERLPAAMRISTIDSFQGQEQDIIIVSLVRSNEDGDIGFLKDYRRMNVAMTRAKELLIITGDSATLGNDPFYRSLLEYVEACGVYRTIWEFGDE